MVIVFIIIVNISIAPLIVKNDTINLFDCKVVIYKGNTYTYPTVIRDTLKAIGGCDSVYKVVNININPITARTSTQTFTSCKAIVYNGSTYSTINNFKRHSKKLSRL